MSTRLWGPERLANTTTTGSQSQPAVTALSNGGYVVAWTDAGPTEALTRFQQYDAWGNPVGGEQTVNFLNTGSQTRPQVVQLSDGNLYFAQVDYDNASDNDIVGGVVTLNNTFVRYQDAALNPTAALDTPVIGALASGGSVTVWYDPSANGGDIRMTILNGSGATVSAAQTVNTNAGSLAGIQKDPAVAVSQDRSLIAVAWVDSAIGNGDIRLRLFGADGGNLVSDFAVTNNVSTQEAPSVTFLNNGRVLVAWADSEAEGPGLYGVLGRIYTTSGVAIGNPFLLNSTTYNAQDAVKVTALPNGGFVAVWQDGSGVEPDTGGSIRLQAFDGNGGKVGGEIVVNSTTIGSQFEPVVTALTDGRVVVAWTDPSGSFGDNSGLAVRTQIIDPRDGSITGTTSSETLLGHNLANDEIRGFGGNDILYGLGGNDVLYGQGGNDRLFGGAGDDTAAFNVTYASASVVRLAHGSIRAGGPAGEGVDLLRGIEHVAFTDRTIDVRGYAASDVNGDGDSDVVLYSQSTGIVTRLDMQDGFQVGSGKVGEMGSSAWRVQQTGDFNYDANSDLVLKNTSTGQFYIWTQFGGTQSGGKDLGVIGTSWDVVSTGDYNADGNFDLLWRNGANGQFYVWTFNSAMTQTGSANLGILGTNWTGGPSGDFDGDGDSDVLLRNTTNGQFYVYTMQNGAQAGGVNLGILGTDWTIAEVGDFNGDMRSDIALKNTSTGQFYLWLMNADLTYTGANLGNIGTDWNITATGDYNADGTDDLLWRNTTTGQTYVWSMQEGRQADTGSHHLGFLSSDLIIV